MIEVMGGKKEAAVSKRVHGKKSKAHANANGPHRDKSLVNAVDKSSRDAGFDQERTSALNFRSLARPPRRISTGLYVTFLRRVSLPTVPIATSSSWSMSLSTLQHLLLLHVRPWWSTHPVKIEQVRLGVETHDRACCKCCRSAFSKPVDFACFAI